LYKSYSKFNPFIYGYISSSSEEEETFGYISLDDVRLNRLAYQCCQFVSALHACRYLDSSLPVIIVKSLFKSKLGQWLLCHAWFVMHHNILCWCACPLGNFLWGYMEIISVNGQLIEDATAWRGVKYFGSKFASWVSSWSLLKKSCVNFFVYCQVNKLRFVILIFSFLTNFEDDFIEGLKFIWNLPFYLRDTQSLSINNDQLWTIFILFDVELGPILKDSLEVLLWNVLFSFKTSFTITDDFSALRIKSANKSQCKSPLSFGNWESSIHHFFFLEILTFLLDLPSNSTHFLIHLNENHGGSRDGVTFLLSADCSLPHKLTGKLEITCNESFKLSIVSLFLWTY